MIFRTLALILLVLLPSLAEAQRPRLFQRLVRTTQTCPGGVCPIDAVAPIVESTAAPAAPVELVAGQQVSESDWYKILAGPNRKPTTEESAVVREFAKRATRILNGNACGTGNFCGRDTLTGKIYIMTNAHVASTRIGHTVRCQALTTAGLVEEFTGRIVEAGFSSRTRTDWALLEASAEFMAGITPIQLSKEKPDPNKITGTWGCPRCEVPRGQVVQTVRMGSVWQWQPNSIGGQSGSAVVQDGKEFGLLTWTENGNGSGQFTANIWQQSKNQNTDGPARTGAEVPVAIYPAVELREGYHKEQASLGEYPIWAEPAPMPDPDPQPTDPPTHEPGPNEKELKSRLGDDWEKFCKIMLEVFFLKQ